VEEGLRMVLRSPQKKAGPKRVRLVTVKGGLPRDLDLSSREKMYDWIEKTR
jgi:hypothetical protein